MSQPVMPRTVSIDIENSMHGMMAVMRRVRCVCDCVRVMVILGMAFYI